MLTSLCIDNYTIVSHLELDFSQGMTAFTGETGAGKSIMIDALMLALGERADASVIRKGADKCDISATFIYDTSSPPSQFCEAHDISIDDQTIVLRRIIYAEGRSKSYINGQPFPLQKIKELSEMLVDIHGQHQHQTLLHHKTHRQQLDQYAHHAVLQEEVSLLYRQTLETSDVLNHLNLKNDQTNRVAFLEAQYSELEALNIEEDEMQRLHEEHQMLHHALEYLEQSQYILDTLSSDEHPGLIKSIHHLLQRLRTLPEENTHIKNSLLMLQNALIQCEEARDEISHFSSKVPLDSERLSQVEERMSLLHQTARKYHIETHQLADEMNRLSDELSELIKTQQEIALLQVTYEEQMKKYHEKALLLRASRVQHAPSLAEELTNIIQRLGMPKGYITIDITPLDKPQAHGLDKVEYIVCTNPGMPPDVLTKIASGGELSRIGLAIHVTTATRGASPTLLFDEVDVGIGGTSAALVGQLLHRLGERLQVFCVTHQPQVAAFADHHFVVKKYSDNEQTFSSITPLTTNEKIDEIARMLGGLTITEQTRSHARELVEGCQ